MFTLFDCYFFAMELEKKHDESKLHLGLQMARLKTEEFEKKFAEVLESVGKSFFGDKFQNFMNEYSVVFFGSVARFEMKMTSDVAFRFMSFEKSKFFDGETLLKFASDLQEKLRKEGYQVDYGFPSNGKDYKVSPPAMLDVEKYNNLYKDSKVDPFLDMKMVEDFYKRSHVFEKDSKRPMDTSDLFTLTSLVSSRCFKLSAHLPFEEFKKVRRGCLNPHYVTKYFEKEVMEKAKKGVGVLAKDSKFVSLVDLKDSLYRPLQLFAELLNFKNKYECQSTYETLKSNGSYLGEGFGRCAEVFSECLELMNNPLPSVYLDDDKAYEFVKVLNCVQRALEGKEKGKESGQENKLSKKKQRQLEYNMSMQSFKDNSSNSSKGSRRK